MERAHENRRSDVNAKRAFCADLIQRGYDNPRVIGSPADVTASKEGAAWYFEVKYTAKHEVYFGAATLTEWMAAVADPEHFRFVVAYQNSAGWQFDEYTVDEFMAYSYIPPFKVYFSVPVGKRPIKIGRAESKRIHLTEARLRAMGEVFETLRSS